MPEYAEKLNYFSRVVLDEAAQENEKLIAALEARLAAALRDAEDALLRETYRHVSRKAADIRAEAGRRVSQHMMDGKRRLALRRETIARDVFAEVAARLAAYTATPDYSAGLRTLFSRLVAQYGTGEGRVLYLRKCDLPRAADIIGDNPQVSVVAGEFTMGGLVLDHPAKGIRIDATFDASFHALDGHFAELFGISLADEV